MTATTEPTEFRAGDTLEWDKSLSLYTADLWTLKYELRNAASTLTITAGADGETHQVSELASATASYTPGDYSWVGHVIDKATTLIRHTVLAGNMTILTDLAAAGATDDRSYAQITLDAIEAVIQGRASKDQMSYTIHDRQLTRMSVDDLFKFRDQFKGEVADEAAAIAGTSAKRISTVF